MNSKKIRGFTLMELLTVIAIIVILIGLISPALRRAREQANEQKAKAMIASLEVAVNMYYTDIGNYPTTLSKLMDTANNPRAPYMDNKDFDGTNFDDPWGNDYTYTSATNGYTISTTTPDGKVIKVTHP